MNHLFIPDVQGHHRRSYRHLEWAGNYIKEKRPDRIIIAGDWGDMPALSAWDRTKGGIIRYGFTVRGDIDHHKKMLDRLMKPWLKRLSS